MSLIDNSSISMTKAQKYGDVPEDLVCLLFYKFVLIVFLLLGFLLCFFEHTLVLSFAEGPFIFVPRIQRVRLEGSGSEEYGSQKVTNAMAGCSQQA